MRRTLWRPVAGKRRRRSSSRGGLFNLTRLAGALLMLGASASLNWLTAPDRFQLDAAQVNVAGLHYTPFEQADALLRPEVDGRPNLFRVRTLAIERSLEELPAVARVDVQAALPDALAVRVVEREPAIIWQAAGQSLLVDADGIVISAAEVATEDLPLIVDRRSGARAPQIGGTFDSIDLEVALRLASLAPATIESQAGGLGLEVEDEHGWLLVARPSSWQAAFGHYTPNLRPTSLIDQQVQCLRSLLAPQEDEIEMVFLAPAEDRCGTFRARPTPDARIFQNVRWHAAVQPAIAA